MGLPYRRVLLKLSGEALMGDQPVGYDAMAMTVMASSILELSRSGIGIGIVIGGGNLFRGRQAASLNLQRVSADNMGMLATLMNGLALAEVLSNRGMRVKVLSALSCPRAVDNYTPAAANAAIADGHIVILVGGTGNPYFTTDTCAALRALEIGAQLLLKATTVDGVYDKDPKKHPEAKRYDTISFSDVLTQNLGVMDATAIALCRENNLPVLVFDLFSKKSLSEVISDRTGTYVSNS